LNSPESVIWDNQTRKFLISNAADGKIQSVGESGNTSVFSNEVKGSHGLCFYGLYSVVSCYKDEIYVADRLTGRLIRKHKIVGALFLNGICYDGKSAIYVSDFSKRKIFKLENIDTSRPIVTTLCNLDKVPNGIAYNELEQELVVMTWGSQASILHISTNQGKVLRNFQTNLSNLEAVVSDGDKGFYLTSWVPGGLYHYDGKQVKSMNETLEQATGLALNGKSELFVLSSLDKRFRAQPILVEERQKAEEEVNLSAFPNPMSINSLISYELPEAGAVNISVYDCQGNLIERLVMEKKGPGKHSFFYDRGNKSSGLYFINIQTPSGNKAIAVTLVD
jgi:hypothetical protein